MWTRSLGPCGKSDKTPRDSLWRAGAEIPHIPSCRKRGAKGVRILRPPLPTISIVVHHVVSLLYALHPFTDAFVFPRCELDVAFMGKLARFAFASILTICGGDIK